jgi:hypothetical protein
MHDYKCVSCRNRFNIFPGDCPYCGNMVISNVEPDPSAKGKEGVKSSPNGSPWGCLLFLVILGLVSQVVDNDKPLRPAATESGVATFSPPHWPAPSDPFTAHPPRSGAPPLVSTPQPKSATQTLVGGGLFVDPEGREPFLDLESNAPYVVLRYYGDRAVADRRIDWFYQIYHRHRDGALVTVDYGDLEEHVLIKKLRPYELERFQVNNSVTFVQEGGVRHSGDVPVYEDPVACPGLYRLSPCKHAKNASDSDVSFTPPPPGPIPPGSWKFRFVNHCDETALVDLNNGFRDVTYRVGGGQVKLVPEIPQPDSRLWRLHSEWVDWDIDCKSRLGTGKRVAQAMQQSFFDPYCRGTQDMATNGILEVVLTCL